MKTFKISEITDNEYFGPSLKSYVAYNILLNNDWDEEKDYDATDIMSIEVHWIPFLDVFCELKLLTKEEVVKWCKEYLEDDFKKSYERLSIYKLYNLIEKKADSELNDDVFFNGYFSDSFFDALQLERKDYL